MIVCCNSQVIIGHSEIDAVQKLMFIRKNCIIHLIAPAPILLKTHFTKQFGRNPPNFKLTQVESWLSKQLAYTLLKPLYQSFQTHPVVLYAVHELW